MTLQADSSMPSIPQGRFQLLTIKGDESDADVAIDDITIKQGACGTAVSTTVRPAVPTTPEPQSERQWDCNFETERCYWVVDGTGWTKSAWSKQTISYII